jgi:hypothetical protein
VDKQKEGLSPFLLLPFHLFDLFAERLATAPVGNIHLCKGGFRGFHGLVAGAVMNASTFSIDVRERVVSSHGVNPLFFVLSGLPCDYRIPHLKAFVNTILHIFFIFFKKNSPLISGEDVRQSQP